MGGLGGTGDAAGFSVGLITGGGSCCRAVGFGKTGDAIIVGVSVGVGVGVRVGVRVAVGRRVTTATEIGVWVGVDVGRRLTGMIRSTSS